MKPPPFDYLRATTLDEALDALETSDGDGKLLAGGQSLVPLLSLRLAQPALLIDMNNIDELAHPPARVFDSPAVRFGALTRHRSLAQQTAHPLVAEGARWIGHTAIRTRGTIGGSLAHADPNAELPAIALACDGQIHTRSLQSSRTIDAADMFDGIFQTALDDNEILTAVDLNVPTRWGFAELARRHGDFGLVLIVVAEIESSWRVVVGGVAPTPIRCIEAEHALAAGASPDDIGRIAAETVNPHDDLHASADYRRALTRELTRRAAKAALEGTKEGH